MVNRGSGPPPSSYPPPDREGATSEDVPPAEQRMPIGGANPAGPTAASPQPGPGGPRERGPGGAGPLGRPLGVSVLAVLYAVSAVLLLLAAAGAAFGPAVGVPGGMAAFASALFLVFAIASGVVAYGLWNGERWGWYVALVLAGVSVLSNIGSILTGEFLTGLVGLVIAGVIIWYLLKPSVQSWFGVHHETPWSYGPAA